MFMRLVRVGYCRSCVEHPTLFPTFADSFPRNPLVYFGISTNFLGKFCNAFYARNVVSRDERQMAGGNAFSRTPKSVMKFVFSNDLNAKEFIQHLS